MSGESNSDLARLLKALGKNAKVVKKLYAARHAIFKEEMGTIQKRNEKIVALYKMGVSGVKIAKEAGMSSAMVYLIIRKSGAGKVAPAENTAAKKKKPCFAILKGQ
jgi:hypothetical protein